MARYKHIFADLRTNRVIAELPLADLSYETLLMGSGAFSAKVDLGDPKVRKLSPHHATIPSRTALYIERNGVLQWGGIVWTRRYNSQSGHYNLTGAEFSSYLDGHRRYSTDAFFGNSPIETLFTHLVNYAMSGHGAIGIKPVISGATGVSRQRTYVGADLKPILELIDNLANQEYNGFEWANEVAYVGPDFVPTKYLRFSFPQRGRTAEQTRMVFEYPGNIANYDFPEAGDQMADRMWGLGRGEADDPVRVYAENGSRMAHQGWPLLEGVLQTDLVNRAHLQERTNAELARSDLPATVLGLYLRPDVYPELGSYIVGDQARTILTDTRRFDLPFETTVRITGIHVTVDRNGAETVKAAVEPL